LADTLVNDETLKDPIADDDHWYVSTAANLNRKGNQTGLRLTESQITDLQSYLTDLTGSQLSELSDTTISGIAADEILKWSGSAWINNTLSEAGIASSTALDLKPETTSILNTELIATDGLLENAHNAAGMSVVTHNGKQFVGYYNDSEELVLGERVKTASTVGSWTFNTLTGKTLTDHHDDHDYISIAFDEDDIAHVWYGMHVDALQYFRMPTANTIVGTAGSNISMVGTNETQVSYPTPFARADGKLFFTFRDGASGNADVYLYSYTASTTTWVAATGTGTAGLLLDGKTASPTVNAYSSTPYVDSGDIAHFNNIWAESGSDLNKDPFYFSYNMSTGAALKADATSQTVPITPVNSDTIESISTGSQLSVNLTSRSIYKDSANDLHLIHIFNDASANQQIYHYKHEGVSWAKTQLTNWGLRTAKLVTSTGFLADPVTEYLYVIYWNNNEGYARQVIESRDLGVTWSNESYPIGEPNFERYYWNMDYTQWDASGELYRMFQYTYDYNNGGLTANSNQLYKNRGVYFTHWAPAGGKTRVLPNINNILARDDISIKSELGTVNIPVIGSETPATRPGWITTKFNVGTNDSGIGVFHGDGSLTLTNRSGNFGQFSPGIIATPAGSSTRTFDNIIEIDPTLDTGTTQLHRILYRQDDDTDIATRPLRKEFNNATELFELSNDGTHNYKDNTLTGIKIAEIISDLGTPFIRSIYYASSASTGRLDLQHARGTQTSPLIVADDDEIGDIRFKAFDGDDTGDNNADFLEAANITAKVDGTPSTISMPGRLEFGTTPTGSTTPTIRLTIGQAGDFDFGGGTLSNLDLASTALSDTANIAYLDAANTFTETQDIVGDGSTKQIRIARYGGSADVGPKITGRGAEGTLASPTANVDTMLMSVDGTSYDGSTFSPAARIKMRPDGASSSGSTPGLIEISTTPTGTASEVIRLTIREDGTFNFNTVPTINFNSAAITNFDLDESGTGNTIKIRRGVQTVLFDFTTDVATGDGKFYFHIDPSLAGNNLIDVHAEVITAGTTGTTDIQIHNVTQTADMLSTKITIDSTETGSDTAAAAAVIDTANDDVAENDLIRIDVDAISTTAPKGLIVTLGFREP